MNSETKSTILKNFFRLAFPSLLWIVSLCILFSIPSPSQLDQTIAGSFYEFAIEQIQNFSETESVLFSILVLLLCSPFYFVFLLFYIPTTAFSIPIKMVYLKAFSLFGFAFWILDLAIISAFFCANDFNLGTMREDTTYVSGEHYEIEFNASKDKATAKKVNEYSGGGEWITNALLYLLRMIVILFVGVVLFIVQTVKILKTPQSDNLD